MQETSARTFKDQRVCCDRCKDALAVWVYAPSTSKLMVERFFCDEHVIRGCSCNEISVDPTAAPGHPDNDLIVSAYGDDGRLLPCCEYDYEEDGFDADFEKLFVIWGSDDEQ
jgi:hypothetical protein